MLTCNLDEMAGRLRVSLPTMRKLVRRYPDFPVVQAGRNGVPWVFDPAAVITFVQRTRDAEAASKAERDALLAQVSLPLEEILPPDEKALSAGDRLKLAQAMSKEDELARQRGFLVPTTEMRQRIEAVWAPLREALLTLPGRYARKYNLPDQVARDWKRDMERELRDLVERLGALAPAEPAIPEDDAEAA